MTQALYAHMNNKKKGLWCVMALGLWNQEEMGEQITIGSYKT
jgi:hypothetical protein